MEADAKARTKMETDYTLKTRIAAHHTHEGVLRRINSIVESFMEDYGDKFRLVNISITHQPSAIDNGWIATASFDNEPELERERRRNYREADLRGLFARAARPVPSSHELAGNMGWVPPRPQPHIAPMRPFRDDNHIAGSAHMPSFRPGTPIGYRTDDPRRTTFHDEHDPTIHPGAIPPGSAANPEVIFSPPMCCCKPMLEYSKSERGITTYRCETCHKVRVFGVGDISDRAAPAPIVKEPAPEDQVSWFRRVARWMGMELDR